MQRKYKIYLVFWVGSRSPGLQFCSCRGIHGFVYIFHTVEFNPNVYYVKGYKVGFFFAFIQPNI